MSAAHGRGIDGIDHGRGGLAARDRKPEDAPAAAPKLAIVGRPNVGKSSLINAILNDKRAIVSDIPGTTRDAVDIAYKREAELYPLRYGRYPPSLETRHLRGGLQRHALGGNSLRGPICAPVGHRCDGWCDHAG